MSPHLSDGLGHVGHLFEFLIWDVLEQFQNLVRGVVVAGLLYEARPARRKGNALERGRDTSGRVGSGGCGTTTSSALASVACWRDRLRFVIGAVFGRNEFTFVQGFIRPDIGIKAEGRKRVGLSVKIDIQRREVL